VPPTLGLGDPVALAKLQPGETVLDLGSGPGRDLLEAARQVGPTGRAIGVDFTPEMIERAQASAVDAGLANVSILNGELEGLPVHCGAVDVVISNCVINLVNDKRAALVEAYRALRPGGRLAILDTAFETEPGPEVRENNDAWCACVGGSLVASDYRAILEDIGFEYVDLTFLDSDCGEACSTDGLTARSLAVTATKPGESTPALRPAVASDRGAVESLLTQAPLPTDGLRIEDTIVALSDGKVVGAVALERFGAAALLRSLVVAQEARKQGLGRKLVIAALEVARWAKVAEVHVLTEDAQRFFTPFGFEAVSGQLVKDACADSALVSGQCCTTATAMRLSFEQADLPLLSKPSIKPLPTFQDGACC
jgi:N-acetylglutamate synthase-like GNAT family acetyltransferase